MERFNNRIDKAVASILLKACCNSLFTCLMLLQSLKSWQFSLRQRIKEVSETRGRAILATIFKNREGRLQN